MKYKLLLGLGSIGALSAVAIACGGDDAVIDVPDSSSTDTSVDSPLPPDDTGVPDTGTDPDTGVTDGGVTDGATTDGATDGGGIRLRCGDASVTDCSQCNGATQPCVYCGTNDASVLTGLCTQFHQNIFNTIPNGFESCRCGPNGDASACPTKYQICTTLNRCHTCSDQNTNNTLTCQGGGKCTYADGGCN